VDYTHGPCSVMDDLSLFAEVKFLMTSHSCRPFLSGSRYCRTAVTPNLNSAGHDDSKVFTTYNQSC